jgi:uncharacterized protein with von Willebrand factor type A (vWA) domain
VSRAEERLIPPAELAVARRLSALAAEMRRGGARLGVGELLAAHRALAAVDVTSREDVFLALRAALCSCHDDLTLFDCAFAAVFGGPGPEDPSAGDEDEQPPAPRVLALSGDPGDGGPDDEESPETAMWSGVEVLRQKDFATYSDAERAAARRLLSRVAAAGPVRISRRTRPTSRRGETLDLRATLRWSVSRGGELVEWRYQGRTLRPRRLVLVCDVSGSMEPYARMLLQYLHTCVTARARVEAFVFGTRLSRVTREFMERDSDQALRRVAARVQDWSGGTRIGAALAELNRDHGRRIGRGSVIVVLSDGWDCGDPDELATEMARLRRCAHRVIWLNPLAARPGYEPVTRGMRAALPNVDHLLPGNSIASLESLAELMEAGWK